MFELKCMVAFWKCVSYLSVPHICCQNLVLLILLREQEKKIQFIFFICKEEVLKHMSTVSMKPKATFCPRASK